MEKERILVCDNKGTFLKMFKRKFKEEFDFSEHPLMFDCKNIPEVFDHFVYVIYDKAELIHFLKNGNKAANGLLFLFDGQLYSNLFLLEEVNSLFLLDGTKTRIEIIKELKIHFHKSVTDSPVKSETQFINSNILEMQFKDYYKALFLLS
ncbi:hypothetical protein [Flavobacterium reichenbachii]|uniref:Uncharacterized protein n=1 Tax=Flavobacterium reichenbachii TaxID=362418 RepID=A0A085ZG32_9FLAO|nr:hypothetical protein [Flavobacterium reichenbachii]KFF03396.1 hypothetical protein IW19_21140 [Flavobacterium reichenbachii]OXB16759.1 hypothetical protein B0A68_06425 [Flavobacterium reichenbachii]